MKINTSKRNDIVIFSQLTQGDVFECKVNTSLC